ncbi:MAG: DUF3106 domain-containing protein [Luteimonas sp.]
MRRAEIVLGAALLLGVPLVLAVAIALPNLLQARLPQLSATLQTQLRVRDTLWQGLDVQARQRLRQRVAAWDALSRGEQRERRERWQAWLALAPDQRLAVKAAALAFAALPPDRQDALRVQFAQRDATDRHGWLLGPELGADFDALQPLLLTVPPPERLPMLDALHGLTPAERADLAVLAHRTAPQQRDALRRGLLSTAADNRGAWLQAQLAR